MSRARRSRVLIISAPRDLHARKVGAHLVEAGVRPDLFDIRHFPSRARVVMARGDASRTALLLPDGTRVDEAELLSVWWRRPQRPRVAPEVTDAAHRRFALNESYCALNGLWQSLRARWVNPVLADSAASHKPYQLEVAPTVGLTVPETVITNDPDAARELVDAHDGRVIYKALAGLPDAWRETRLLRREEAALLDAVRYAPVIFQEVIDGTDLRVTLVGDDIFAAEMDTTRARYAYDIRMDMTVPVRAVKLDATTEASLRGLMRALGLEYGAVDMKRRPDGSLVFLEINPAGQFLHIEELTGMPIARALAARLMHKEAPDAKEARQEEAAVEDASRGPGAVDAARGARRARRRGRASAST